MTITRFRNPLASTLALVVACSLTPVPFTTFAAEGVATFAGHVLQADGRSPQPGVTVVLVRDAGVEGDPGAEFASAPTGEDGSFRIAGADVGTYALLISTSDGAFVAAESITLAAGVNPRRSLTLRHEVPEGLPGAGQSLGTVTWGQWLIAGAIVVAAVAVAKEVTDDVQEPASPF